MTRKAWVLIGWTVAAAAVITVVVLAIRIILSDDDDRPPIIVTNGSMNFDDGDQAHPNKWKPWKQPNANNAKQWTQLHPNGFDVSSFSVTIAGSSDSSCPTSAVPASAVAIEYTLAAGGTKSQVAVQRVQTFSTPGHVKWEPWVTAPADMTIAPNPPTTAASAPPRIVYDPGSGYISTVTLTTASGSTSCAFSKDQTSAVSITIQSVR